MNGIADDGPCIRSNGNSTRIGTIDAVEVALGIVNAQTPLDVREPRPNLVHGLSKSIFSPGLVTYINTHDTAERFSSLGKFLPCPALGPRTAGKDQGR